MIGPTQRRILCILGMASLELVALCGCASSPKVEYFSLESSGEPSASPGNASSAPIEIAQVHLPSSLDRKQMVRQSSPYTLDISDQHRWSAPLDEMIRRVLSQDLLRLLPPDTVVIPSEPAPANTRKIVLNVLQFVPDATGTVQFEASWSVIFPDSHTPPRNRYVRLSEHAAPNDPADQVKSMSLILDRLAASMARAATDPSAE